MTNLEGWKKRDTTSILDRWSIWYWNITNKYPIFNFVILLIIIAGVIMVSNSLGVK